MSDLYDTIASMISLQEGINDMVKHGYFDGNRWRTIEKSDIDKISEGYLKCNNHSWLYLKKAVYRYAPTIIVFNGDFKYFKLGILAENDLKKSINLIKLSCENELKVLDRMLCAYVNHTAVCYSTDIARNRVKTLLEYSSLGVLSQAPVPIAKDIDQFAYWELFECDPVLALRVSEVIQGMVDVD